MSMKDDNSQEYTTVMDAAGIAGNESAVIREFDAGDTVAAGSAPASVKSVPGGRSRFAAAVMWLALIAGSLTAAFSGAFAFAVANFWDVSQFSEEQIENEFNYNAWLTKFSSQHAQEDFVGRSLTIAIIAGIVVLAALIILSIFSGRYSGHDDDISTAGGAKIKLNRFDRLWTELHLAGLAGFPVAAVFIASAPGRMLRCDNNFAIVDLTKIYEVLSPDEYCFGISNDMVFWYCAAGIAASAAAAAICFISLIKKLKAKEFLSSSLIWKILRILGIGAAKAGRGAVRASKSISGSIKRKTRTLTAPEDSDNSALTKLMIKYCLGAACLIAGPVFIGLFMVYAWNRSFAVLFLLLIISIVTASLTIIRKVRKLAEIREGVIRVRSGDLSSRITVDADENGPKTDLDKLASDINHISDATDAAIRREIKNQRLKTDLISNVSHDLRTPLTSMISYLDILDKEGLDSEDAPAHLEIVREKTDRLKVLTDELFEAAKASSGNIPCEIEDIDLAALIDQSLAEMGDRLAAKSLIIKKKIDAEHTMVRADGNLLYRVIENLLSNISKYALEGSRVYIDVSEHSSGIPTETGSPGRLLLEVKNISKDELNISADELMERFTRGDSARNTEGSGLGLAIARDLTTLMGGSFDITIDGDMFKASVYLNRA